MGRLPPQPRRTRTRTIVHHVGWALPTSAHQRHPPDIIWIAPDPNPEGAGSVSARRHPRQSADSTSSPTRQRGRPWSSAQSRRKTRPASCVPASECTSPRSRVGLQSNPHSHDAVRFPCARSTSRIPTQNAGRSSGFRLDTKCRSTTTSASSQIAPALIKSSLIPGDPVTFAPL